MSDLLEELRPRAFAIAYRMLGSASEAEDIVQDALMRLHGALEAGERISVPQAYLATIVTRLSINELRSARVRREVYVGEWIPEPVLTGGESADPAFRVEMAESLSLAFLSLLEILSPERRAAFLLREVFDYPYAEIAGILGKSEAAVRQLVTRARRRVEQDRARAAPFRPRQVREAGEVFARRFFTAAWDGDVEAIEALLAEDVALYGDGGGKVPALPRPMHGRRQVARTLTAWIQQGRRIEGFSFKVLEVNGQPGAVTLDSGGRLISVIALEFAGNHVHAVRSIANPDKLAHLGPVADYAALVRARGARAGGSGSSIHPS